MGEPEMVQEGSPATLQELLAERYRLEDEIGRIEDSILPKLDPLRAQMAEIEKAIDGRIAAPIQGAFQRARKDTGTVNLEVDRVAVKVTRGKTVKWDQSLLFAIFKRIQAAGDDPNAYIQAETQYKVSENAFKEWPDAVKNVFMPARTVTPGKPKIEFIPLDEEIPF
jgi:hypothetical protein